MMSTVNNRRASAIPIQRATVFTPDEYDQLKRPLSDSWHKAFGMLSGKLPKDPVAWQRKIRSEWDERLEHQIALATRHDNR